MASKIGGVLLALGLSACASQWKIHGGPQECVQMCKSWDMELTGMVGVGNQDKSGPGATACVCELRRKPATVPVAQAGTTASTSAVVVALQEAERQRQEEQSKPER